MKITIVLFVMTAAFGLIACDNTKHNTLTEQEKAEDKDSCSGRKRECQYHSPDGRTVALAENT